MLQAPCDHKEVPTEEGYNTQDQRVGAGTKTRLVGTSHTSSEAHIHTPGKSPDGTINRQS